MTHEYLKTMISDLSEIEFDVRPNGELLSLARIYVSLYNLVACNSLDEEFGDRSHYLGKIDSLFGLLSRNCAAESDPVLLSRMIDTMYSLACEPLTVVDFRKKHRCDEAAAELIDRFAQREGLLQTGVCRCIADFIFPYPEPDDEYLLSLKHTVSRWVASLDGDRWPDITPEVALERIGVMNMNSYMFFDGTNDRLISRIFDRYRSLLHIPENTRNFDVAMLPVLGGFYDTAMQGNAYEPDRSTAALIADFLRDYSRTLTFGHGVWIYCMTYAITSACERISDAVQQSALVR